LIFIFALEYACSIFQGNQERLELDGTSQLQVHVCVKFLGGNINSIKKNTESQLGPSKEVIVLK
jgi:hypothetical protein